MMVHQVSSDVGERRTRKRVGRGIGSGHGKTSGRGHKGAGSRSGHKNRLVFEGGQMPLVRRIAKRGFNNRAFGTEYILVRLKDLEKRFENGDLVDLSSLNSKGVIKTRAEGMLIKVVGGGELTKRLTVKVDACTRGAAAVVTAAGGTVTTNQS